MYLQTPILNDEYLYFINTPFHAELVNYTSQLHVKKGIIKSGRIVLIDIRQV